MIEKMQAFAGWDKDTQAACVCLYNMSLGRQPQHEEPLPDVRQSAIKEKKPRRRYFPMNRWSEDDRLELFTMLDSGCRDWVAMARRFGRSEGAIRAQHDKAYLEWKGE